MLSARRAGFTKLFSISSTTRPPGLVTPAEAPALPDPRKVDEAPQRLLEREVESRRAKLAPLHEQTEVADRSCRPGHRDPVEVR